MKNKIIILSGPTASGKSALALDIAQSINAVIINCDSKQIYQEIPIVTAQPSKLEQNTVEHRLYGYVNVSENYSVADWVEAAKLVIDEVLGKNQTPLLVGGTGMYIKGLIEGFSFIPKIDPTISGKIRELAKELPIEEFYNLLFEKDPAKAQKLKPNDIVRITRALEVFEQTGKSISYWQNIKPTPLYDKDRFKVFFLHPDRKQVYKNCEIRLGKMLEAGVLEEIKQLSKMNLDPLLPSMKAHAVPEFLSYLNNEITLDQAIEKAALNTRHYIKRQYTWFRHQMEYAHMLDPKDAREKMVQLLLN